MKTRLLLSLTCLIFALTLLLPTLREADACCMVPVDFKGRVGQAEQKALLIHREGVEDLILGITYRITPDKDGNTPKKLTWLIALPAEPMEKDGYGLADPELFDELGGLAYETLVEQVPGEGRDGLSLEKSDEQAQTDNVANSIELGRAVTVGPYDIQPVRGVGQNALNGLNAYLKQRGFPVEDPEHMAWFVEHGFTFLCIEVTPKEGEKNLSAGEPLPPLRVRFETEHPYYPLRYSSQQGDFSLSLYMLTDKPIDLEKSAGVLRAVGWKNRPGTIGPAINGKWKSPQTVSTKTLLKGGSALNELPKESGTLIKQEKNWSFALINGRPNPKSRPISDWTGDCFFTLKGQDAAPLATVVKVAAR